MPEVRQEQMDLLDLQEPEGLPVRQEPLVMQVEHQELINQPVVQQDHQQEPLGHQEEREEEQEEQKTRI